MLIMPGQMIGGRSVVGGVLPKIHLSSPSIQVITNQPYMDMNNFTAIIEVVDGTPATNTGNGVIFHMGDASGNNNRYLLYKVNGDSDIDLLIQSGGAVQASTSRANETLRASKKQRWGISANNGVVKLYLNGVYIDGFLSQTQPNVAAPVIGIGTQQNNVTLNYDDAAQSINEFVFYDKGLSETKMRQLTRTDDHDVTATFNAALKLMHVGGQSNAVGLALGTNTYTNTSRMKLIATEGGLESYSDPADQANNEIFGTYFADTSPVARTGFHGEMLDTLAGEFTDDTFAVHVCAKGATSLVGNWMPLSVNTASRYQVSDMTYAYLQRLFVAKAHAPIAAHIWYQGESDAANGTSGTVYAANLVNLYDLIRVTHGNIPLITVSLHDDMSAGTYPSKAAIRAAQDGFVYSNHFIVPALGYETDAGNLHHTLAGYNALGAAIAASLGTNVFS